MCGLDKAHGSCVVSAQPLVIMNCVGAAREGPRFIENHTAVKQTVL